MNVRLGYSALLRSIRVKLTASMRVVATSLAVMFCIGGCMFNPFAEPPGEGRSSNEAYRKLGPVIQALEAYKGRNGVYPDTLQQLVPIFLNELPVLGQDNSNLRFEYTKTENEFSLTFFYHGPGTNACEYKFPKGWTCYGAY